MSETGVTLVLQRAFPCSLKAAIVLWLLPSRTSATSPPGTWVLASHALARREEVMVVPRMGSVEVVREGGEDGACDDKGESVGLGEELGWWREATLLWAKVVRCVCAGGPCTCATDGQRAAGG